jgi:hypothetical protein
MDGPTFDCRIILIDEMALDELDGQAGFADTTAADDDELVFSQELRRNLTLAHRTRITVATGRRIMAIGDVPSRDGRRTGR